MQKTFLVFLIALAGPVWAEICDVVAPPQSDRLEKIVLADGRQIYMLGYNHGDRELPFAMAELVKKRASKMSNQDLQAQIAQLAESVSTAVDEEKVDFEQLRGLLQGQPGLRFVGFETEDKYVHPNLENYQLMLNDFRAMVQARAPGEMTAEMDLERVVLGAAGALTLAEPDLFKDRELRGFESSNAGDASDKATRAADQALEQLKALAAGDTGFLSNVSGTKFQLEMMYSDYSAAMDSAILQKIQAAQMPERYRAATLGWVRLKLAEMAADKQREHDVVENIIATNQSGVLVMGSEHLSGIMDRLQKRCVALRTVANR